MLLTRLQLHNFGPFHGSYRIELRPLARQRPIILFGGKNGVGKTTLLEAIQLCLHGRRLLGTRATEQEYQTYVREKIYRGTPTAPPIRRASVAMEFEHGHAGLRDVYAVERSWTLRGERLSEGLFVTQDGALLPGLDRKHWQEFIDNLVPPALAQLFFFDGERVQALAEDHDDDVEFGNAVRALLGLDLVERLQADLAVYVTRQARQGGDDLYPRLEALERQVQDHAAREQRLRQEEAHLHAQLDRQRSLISRQEDTLAREGGTFAGQRGALQAERAQLVAERGELEDEVRSLCAGLLPFALIPELTNRLVLALVAEDEWHRTAIAHDARNEFFAAIECSLQDLSLWLLPSSMCSPEEIQRTLLPRLRESMRQSLASVDRGPSSPPQTVHGLASADSARIILLVKQAKAEAALRARRLAVRLSLCIERIRQIDDHLRRAPADDLIRPLFDQLADLHAGLTQLNERFADIQSQRRTAELAAEHLAREIQCINDELSAQQHVDRQVRLAARAQNALQEFHAALSQVRLGELEQTLVHCFARLAQKQDLIARVTIDPRTFRLALFNRDGQLIPKETLSAGEKQVYAIALLWSLAQVSGRKLPMIVDTPLARLDSEHRQNLVKNYFPYAAEQILILSTDTEIDETLLDDLLPAISRYYYIEYDPAERASQVVGGYFWQPVDDRVGDVLS